MSSDRALLRASRLSNQIATSLEALALGLVLSSSLCSQDLRFGRLTPADGLSQYSVNTMLQDRQGYLWLGTQDGLNRYDGYSIEVFKADLSDPRALGDNFITGILEDSQGDLWVSTNFGLNRLDRESGTFERFVNDPANDHSLVNTFARFIYEAPDQVLWIGSAGGYSRFDRATQRFRGFAHDPEDPQSLASNNVMDLLDDGKGHLWVATYGAGLDRCAIDTGDCQHFTSRDGLPTDSIYSVLADGLGSLWISTNQGLVRFDPETREIRQYVDSDGLGGNEFNGDRSFAAIQVVSISVACTA